MSIVCSGVWTASTSRPIQYLLTQEPNVQDDNEWLSKHTDQKTSTKGKITIRLKLFLHACDEFTLAPFDSRDPTVALTPVSVVLPKNPFGLRMLPLRGMYNTAASDWHPQNREQIAERFGISLQLRISCVAIVVRRLVSGAAQKVCTSSVRILLLIPFAKPTIASC